MPMESGFESMEKEDVAGLNFPAESVLSKEKDVKALKTELERANTLGNMEHYKVKIYFEDNIMKRVVHTTIWAVTEQAILLKKKCSYTN